VVVVDHGCTSVFWLREKRANGHLDFRLIEALGNGCSSGNPSRQPNQSEDYECPLLLLWIKVAQCLLSDGQVIHDPHNAGDMTAAFEAEPLFLQRADFSSKSGGAPDHGDVDALQVRNSGFQAGRDSPFQISPFRWIALSELNWGNHEFGVV
jgi:hypothetical protein